MAHPQTFFKYLPTDGAEMVLRAGSRRWSSPLRFDDPAEFRRMPRFSPSLTEAASTFVGFLVGLAGGDRQAEEERYCAKTRFLLNSFRTLLKSGSRPEELIREMETNVSGADERFEIRLNEFVKDLTLESTRVLCVSSDGDNQAMWEKYAEGGRGALLEFRHLPERSTPLLAAKPVAYSTEPPVIASGLDLMLFGNTPELRARCLESVVYAKREEWRYQREWRVVTWRTDDDGALFSDYSFHPAELASVTVGDQAPDSWALTIRQLVAARYPFCKLFRRRPQVRSA